MSLFIDFDTATIIKLKMYIEYLADQKTMKLSFSFRELTLLAACLAALAAKIGMASGLRS